MTIDILKARDIDEQTFFHNRLHPLTKMIATLSVLLITGLWLDIRYLLPLLIIGLIFAMIAKTPKAWFVVMFVALLLTWYPTLRTTIAQANPEYFKVLDPEWASTRILTLDVNFLNLGTMGITYGTLYWLAGRLVRFATVVTWAILLVSTTPANEMANTLYALKVPYQMVFVFQMTYKFIPNMASIINQISEAQKLRGWNLKTWNPVKLVKRSLPIANPMIRRTAMMVEQITTATQIRGFGTGAITPMRDLKLTNLDKIVIAFFALFFVVALLGLIIFKAGMI